MKSNQEISISTSVADEREEELGGALDEEVVSIDISNINKIEQEDIIKTLEKKMKDAAKEMKFELAAIYRDKIEEIKREVD